MARWFYYHYKGYQICRWSDSTTYFITKDCDTNNPCEKGITSEKECMDYINNL